MSEEEALALAIAESEAEAKKREDENRKRIIDAAASWRLLITRHCHIYTDVGTC